MYDLLKSIFDLAKGTLIAQVIGIITLPIITRLYTADDFGYYSLIVQISILLAILFNLRQEQGIQLENNVSLIRNHIFNKNKLFIKFIYAFVVILVISVVINKGVGISISIISGILLVLIGYLSSLRIFESKYTEVGFSEFLNKFTYALFATISIKFLHLAIFYLPIY